MKAFYTGNPFHFVAAELRSVHLACGDERVVTENVGFNATYSRNGFVTENAHKMVPLSMLNEMLFQNHTGDLGITEPTISDKFRGFFRENRGWLTK